jgi:hypothetical protein
MASTFARKIGRTITMGVLVGCVMEAFREPWNRETWQEI